MKKSRLVGVLFSAIRSLIVSVAKLVLIVLSWVCKLLGSMLVTVGSVIENAMLKRL